MAVSTDILATYRRPQQVIARLLLMGPREDRLLAILMGGCTLMFIAQMPRLARESHLTGQELNMLLGGALLGIVFIAPLALYALAWVSHLILRALGGQGDGYQSRLALFWAFLAATPILLLNGLVAGFIGQGSALNAVGVFWFLIFVWFWIAGLRQAYWGKS